MRTLEFRQAEHFLAVVEHGGVVRAAAALRLPQPTLSQSIRALERDLGTPLFLRVGRGLVPTPVGRELVKPARALLRDVSTAQASVAELSDMHGGHVDIGTTPSPFESALPALVGEFRKAFPKVTMRISEYDSEADVEGAVRDGRVEIGFGYVDSFEDRSGPTGLESQPLRNEEVCAVLPRSVAEGLPEPLPFSQLPDLPVVAVAGSSNGRVAVEDALRRAEKRTTLGVVTAHRQAIVPLVAAGAGMCWTGRAMVENSGEDDVVALSMDPPILLTLLVMHRPGALAPATRALLDTVLG